MSKFIVENFGPHYRPGRDALIDAAANSWAKWAGRLDDRRFDALSNDLRQKVAEAGLGDHVDPYDASRALQNHVRQEGGTK